LKGDPIPATDHLALHCQPNTGMEFDASGAPIGITREGFRVDEDGISTNWIEFDGGDFAAACLMVASARTARKIHRVGVFNVGAAQDVGRSVGEEITATHDPIEPPEPPNPGHALLSGDFSSGLLDLLAPLVELHPFTDAALALRKA
jgi:hypothetical protein